MPSSPTVLIYGHDPVLLATRSWVLESAGFTALRVENLEEALRLAKAQPIDLLMLCHTLSLAEQDAALAAADALEPKLKKLVARAGMHAPIAKMGDDSIDVFAGTKAWIAAVRTSVAG